MSDFAAMFQSSEPEPDPEGAPEAPTPAWFGPPDDELGTCVPASLVVGRSENGVIALQSITVFSTGARLDLVAVARGLSNSKANALFHDQHNPASEDGIPDGYPPRPRVSRWHARLESRRPAPHLATRPRARFTRAYPTRRR